MKNIKFRCNCGHTFEVDLDSLALQWDVVETHEREGMGVERLYEAVCIVLCPSCKKEITLTVLKWEYPVGTFSGPEVQTKGAEVL